MAVTLGYCLYHEGQTTFNYTVSSNCKVLVLGNFQRLGSIGTPQFTFSSVTYNFTVASNNGGDCSLCYYLNPPAGTISITPNTTGIDGTFVVGFYGDNITYKTGSSKTQDHTYSYPTTSFTHSPDISLNSNEYFVVLSRNSGGAGVIGTTGTWFKDASNADVTNKEEANTADPPKQVNGAIFYKTGSSGGIVVTTDNSSNVTEDVVSFILQPESSGATGNMFAMF